MARRRKAERRPTQKDVVYQSELVACFINQVMRQGKKSVAERIVYGAMKHIKQQTDSDPVELFEKALDNVKPHLEVKSRRVGGATYQVPIEVSYDRQVTLALRWIIGFSKGRRGAGMSKALAMELMDAANGQGPSIKKREDTHKMAQANKAFAHYRW